jgi:hypothetical protein
MDDQEYIDYLLKELKSAEEKNMALTREFQLALSDKEVRRFPLFCMHSTPARIDILVNGHV